MNADMADVSIPASLGLSVLGMIVVFLVLVFLMVIIYIMTAIIRSASNKPAAIPSAVPVPPPSDITAAAAEETSQAAAIPEIPSASPPAAGNPQETPGITYVDVKQFSDSRKYSVAVNGVTYEVDAQTGETVRVPDVSESAVPGGEAAALPKEAPGGIVQSSSLPEGVRKFKVVIDGAAYEVDAETGSAVQKSNSGRAQL